uniref:Uncharacterized 40.9 kDa protein in 16S rRNA 3'region n=1 Tax=Euglena gracilis TaxID=3039 RepID=YCXA_EUGGR|nr:hypothetical protein EugrCp065 [Euglena gracilis]P31561.1 RecName: Full=Uncharacterized 40.9 kDa protein in 16S rRNA 3'region; AltName: Full=ORF350 [Euglena gracilis]CAA50140.1 hypothetical protein [Euglena gracilis]
MIFTMYFFRNFVFLHSFMNYIIKVKSILINRYSLATCNAILLYFFQTNYYKIYLLVNTSLSFYNLIFFLRNFLRIVKKKNDPKVFLLALLIISKNYIQYALYCNFLFQVGNRTLKVIKSVEISKNEILKNDPSLKALEFWKKIKIFYSKNFISKIAVIMVISFSGYCAFNFAFKFFGVLKESSKILASFFSFNHDQKNDNSEDNRSEDDLKSSQDPVNIPSIEQSFKVEDFSIFNPDFWSTDFDKILLEEGYDLEGSLSTLWLTPRTFIVMKRIVQTGFYLSMCVANAYAIAETVKRGQPVSNDMLQFNPTLQTGFVYPYGQSMSAPGQIPGGIWAERLFLKKKCLLHKI